MPPNRPLIVPPNAKCAELWFSLFKNTYFDFAMNLYWEGKDHYYIIYGNSL